MEAAEPCNVCGNENVQLVDGYYYCVECGTQDLNFRETVVEQTMLADGTFANVTTKKFVTVKDGIEMSQDWHKWHAYNFMLCGLIDELIALGASPTIRMKALWIWVRYIKHFQESDELLKSKLDINDTSKLFEYDDESGNDEKSNDEQSKKKKIINQKKTVGKYKDINKKKAMLLSILYLALNFDKSDIQLTHLFRFVKEKRISLYDCIKFVPKEIKINSLLCGNLFTENPYSYYMIRKIAIRYIKILRLGTPIVPDLNKILDNIVTELCLPRDIKHLVLSLIQKVPCDNLEINMRSLNDVNSIPFYEGIVMSYVIVAMKMCFGLDDDYELKVSDVVDRINEENNYTRSYRGSMFEECSDRLFSFREWCSYIQLRKSILTKYYLPMAMQFEQDPDDFVFMEHVDIKNKSKIDIKDEVTLDILNRMPLHNVAAVIPKTDFEWSLTPLSSYMDVIQQYIQDADLKTQLNEDFSQYSLNYVFRDFMLKTNVKIILTGVTKCNKVTNSRIYGTLASKQADKNVVFVRYCDNKNWVKTKPPTVEHITKEDEVDECRDKNSDHGYDSNTERTSDNNSATDEKGNDSMKTNEEEKQLETIVEEDNDRVIFDDEFEQINLDDLKDDNDNPEDYNDYQFDDPQNGEDLLDSKCRLEDSKIDMSIHEFLDADQPLPYSNRIQFNPDTFNREETIKELILAACKDYKIPIPKEYNTQKELKRKLPEENGPKEAKKRNKDNKDKSTESKKDVDSLIAAYYNELEQELMKNVSDHVKSFVGTMDLTKLNITYEDDIEPENIEPNIEQPTVDNKSDDDDHENDEDDIEERDPKFDDKVYDAKQLYVKLSNVEDMEDIFDVSVDMEKVIAKQLAGPQKKPTETIKLSDRIQFEDDSDSDDSENDVPLSVLKNERLREQEKADTIEKLVNLVENDDVDEYNYWMRHYNRMVFNSPDLTQPFDNELVANSPKAFNFVINECAAVLDCTAYTLYRLVQNLEQALFARV